MASKSAMLLSAAAATASSQLQGLVKSGNQSLDGWSPLQVAAAAVVVTVATQWAVAAAREVYRELLDYGLQGSVVRASIFALHRLPGVAGVIQREQDKAIAKIKAAGSAGGEKTTDASGQASGGKGGHGSGGDGGFASLPAKGLTVAEVETELARRREPDSSWQGKCSGTVYVGGEHYAEHTALVNHAHSLFSYTNPLHADIFASVALMEKEVVAMTGRMLGGGAVGAEDVCGNMTSGGTESILMAVKAARDFMRTTRGITEPELVAAESAHPAYDKACSFFGVRLRRTKVRASDLLADPAAFSRRINRNTVMLIASAPGFPHGLIDPVEKIAALARKHGILLHVDCCLGGFILPFARELGYAVPPFDFSVPGVTSISADVHKYGLACKGTSVVLFRSHALRRAQFTAVTEWTGGLYVSPTVAGSRPGGLVAAAWAAMVHTGWDGYLAAAQSVMEAAAAIARGLQAIPDVELVGRPETIIVAFTCTNGVDVFRVNDELSTRGWHLNALQRPNSVHICVTLQHVPVVDAFLADVGAAVERARSDPAPAKGGMAPIYGMAGTLPDRGAVNDLLVAYMDMR